MSQKEVEVVMERLKRWCKDPDGWGRQRQLAKELGVSEPLVSSWVLGRRLPSLQHWFSIKAILNREGAPKIKKGELLIDLLAKGEL
jgi:transcriptional regulator with XRE-family HTH domain